MILIYSNPPIYRALISHVPQYNVPLCVPLISCFTKEHVLNSPDLQCPRFTVHFCVPPRSTVNRGITVSFNLENWLEILFINEALQLSADHKLVLQTSVSCLNCICLAVYPRSYQKLTWSRLHASRKFTDPHGWAKNLNNLCGIGQYDILYYIQ